VSQSSSVLIPSPVIAGSMEGLPCADTFTIGVDACPGQARLVSGNSPRGWDERQSYGMTGATLVPTGDHLGTHVFHVMLWCEADVNGNPQGHQWTAFQTFFANYLSKAVRFVPGSTRPRALGIYHPVLAAIGVTEVVVDDVTDPIQPDDEDYFEFEIHFREYRAPTLALGKPDAPIPPASTAGPTAEDSYDSQMQQLNAQRDGLGQALLGTVYK
jgi:hypothetical protein